MNAFRRCLEEIDVAGIRALWAQFAPHLPQPQTDDEALYALHEARTRSKTLSRRARAYSVAWLAERDLARSEPRVAAAVGAASSSPDKPYKAAIEGAMLRVAEEMMAAGYDPETDAAAMRAAMLDARARVKAGRVSV